MALSPDIASAIRTVLKIGGTAGAVAAGLTADDITNLWSVAEMFFGAAFALWGVIWSIWTKRPASAEAKAIAVSVVQDKLPATQALGVAAKIDAPAKTPG